LGTVVQPVAPFSRSDGWRLDAPSTPAAINPQDIPSQPRSIWKKPRYHDDHSEI
jgi:hypothetical protein